MFLVETRNRLDALRSGRADCPRPKGPRFDSAHIPDAALERLIQQHPDLDTVNRLRAERVRRLMSKADLDIEREAQAAKPAEGEG